jgi:hypothetical protein
MEVENGTFGDGIEVGLGLLVFGIIGLIFTVSPESDFAVVIRFLIFAVPGLLSVYSLYQAITEETSRSTILIGLLSGLTLFIVTWSLYVVYTSSGTLTYEGEGFFLGTLFGMVAGTILAIAICIRAVAKRINT